MKNHIFLLAIFLLSLQASCNWNVTCGTCDSCSSPCYKISEISTSVATSYCSLNEKSCSSAFPAVIAESHACSNLLKDQCKSCCFTFDSLERCADEFAFGKSLCQSKLVSGGVNSTEVGASQPVGSTYNYCYSSYYGGYGYYSSCGYSSSYYSTTTTTTTDYGAVGGGAGGGVGGLIVFIIIFCWCRRRSTVAVVEYY